MAQYGVWSLLSGGAPKVSEGLDSGMLLERRQSLGGSARASHMGDVTDRHELAISRNLSPGDLMHCRVTTANDTVLKQYLNLLCFTDMLFFLFFKQTESLRQSCVEQVYLSNSICSLCVTF